MILTASSVSDFSNTLSWWERGEYVFSFVVALACFGEYVADFKPKWYGTGEKERDESRKESISKISTLVLVAALVFELVCIVRSNALAGEVIGSINDIATSAAGQSKTALDNAGKSWTLAQSASDSAKPAKETADAAKLEADKAQTKIAGVDRRANVLAYFLSARRVQDESGLENDLRKEFGGEHIAFDSYVGDEEAYWLCAQLVEISKKAGVDSKDECATKQLSRQLPITDLHISAPTIDEGQRLSMILKKPKRVPGYFVGLNVAPEVTVTVGVKPSIPLFPMVKKAKSSKSAKPR